MHFHTTAAAAIAGALLLASCATPGAAPTQQQDSPIVARVDGTAIRLQELDEFIKDELFAQQTRGGDPSRTHQIRSDALDRLIEQRAVEAAAARRGVDPEALVREEVEALGPVTNEEVMAFFAENRDRIGAPKLEDVAPRIRQHLEQERTHQAIVAIASRASVALELEPPRVEIGGEGPSLGPADAPVTIIEFSDFQCPYCRRARPLVAALAARYPNEVRFVYRHLPLESIHPRARPAAEAAACAQDQGLFWEYHDVLFENPEALGDVDLRRYAQELGADTAQFNDCLSTRQHAAEIDADVAAAASIGVSGTPAFVVNGILVFGLQTEEELDRLIRAELARTL
ncbi:MAG: thioredoxin domain-containing protein [Myxococcales bacterium]|nr:thioredoxin domain-containing protein [Myxococcales bacterium]MDH5565911.1 thioredoxin domain-containing protein [Myxococcales bacterium]